MDIKTSDLLMLGAVGVGAYFLYNAGTKIGDMLGGLFGGLGGGGGVVYDDKKMSHPEYEKMLVDQQNILFRQQQELIAAQNVTAASGTEKQRADIAYNKIKISNLEEDFRNGIVSREQYEQYKKIYGNRITSDSKNIISHQHAEPTHTKVQVPENVFVPSMGGTGIAPGTGAGFSVGISVPTNVPTPAVAQAAIAGVAAGTGIPISQQVQNMNTSQLQAAASSGGVLGYWANKQLGGSA